MKTWVVDTCVVLDLVVGSDDQVEAAELVLATAGSVLVSPISYVELGPSFPDPIELREFLHDYAIDDSVGFAVEDAEIGRVCWQRMIARRRSTEVPRRPMADVLIGAYASRRAGLITRNASDFKVLYPQLPCWIPGLPEPKATSSR